MTEPRIISDEQFTDLANMARAMALEIHMTFLILHRGAAILRAEGKDDEADYLLRDVPPADFMFDADNDLLEQSAVVRMATSRARLSYPRNCRQLETQLQLLGSYVVDGSAIPRGTREMLVQAGAEYLLDQIEQKRTEKMYAFDSDAEIGDVILGIARLAEEREFAPVSKPPLGAGVELDF